MKTHPDTYDPAFVKDLFNSMSSSYERVNYVTSFGFSHRWRRQCIHRLPGASAPVVIADIMTGKGEAWPFIRKRYPEAKITAIDISPGMLRHAKLRNRKSFRSTVTIVEHNLLDIDLHTEQYDKVFCTFGLKTFSEQQVTKLAASIKRMLKPGGEFSMIEVSRPDNRALHLLYKLHLRTIVPFFGKLLIGHSEDYQMLWHYTNSFGNAGCMRAAFEAEGLEVTYDRYFFGCATGIHGRRKV